MNAKKWKQFGVHHGSTTGLIREVEENLTWSEIFGSVRGGSVRLLIHSVDEEDKLKRWKKHFAMTRNRITSGDVSLFVD